MATKCCVARLRDPVLAFGVVMFPRRPALVLLVTLAVAPATPAQTQPAPDAQPEHAEQQEPQPSLAEVKLKESLETAAEVAALPRLSAKDISEVLRLTIQDKDLHLASSLPPTDQSAVSAPGLQGITKVAVARAGDDKDAPLYHFALYNFDYTPAGVVSINTSVVQAVPGRLDLTQDYNLLADEVHSVHLIQNRGELVEGEPRVTLHVQLTTAPGVRLQRTAENVVELRRRYPAECARYLDPILRSLRQDGLLA